MPSNCLIGWLVCRKPDFVCFICRKYTMGKNSELERRGIRITDNVVFKIPLHFHKCFKVFLFFVFFCCHCCCFYILNKMTCNTVLQRLIVTSLFFRYRVGQWSCLRLFICRKYCLHSKFISLLTEPFLNGTRVDSASRNLLHKAFPILIYF